MVANLSSQTTRFLQVAGLNNRVAMGTQNQVNLVVLHKMQLLQIIHPITFQLSRSYIPILRSCISTLLIHAFIPKYPFGSLLSVLPQFSSLFLCTSEEAETGRTLCAKPDPPVATHQSRLADRLSLFLLDEMTTQPAISW